MREKQRQVNIDSEKIFKLTCTSLPSVVTRKQREEREGEGEKEK